MFHCGVLFECNETGWMPEELMIKCLNKDWGRSIGAVLKATGMQDIEVF